MTEPRFRSQARAEFREAALFYESQLAGLGAGFVSEVERLRLGEDDIERFEDRHNRG